MEDVLIAVAAKSLVEGFVKNYALPKFSKLAQRRKGIFELKL